MIHRVLWLGRLARDIICLPLVLLIPRKHNKIVFGAWGGRQYGCNPKYLFEYVIQKGGFECYWIGEASIGEHIMTLPGARFVEKGSFAAFLHCLTAKVYVYNVSWRLDILDFPTCGRVGKIYTTHGYPDKKVLDMLDGFGNVACQEKLGSGFRKYLHEALLRFSKWLYDEKSWFSASSEQGDELRVKGEPDRLSYERALDAGLPRADFAVNNAHNSKLRLELREKYAKLLGIDPDKRWYLFVPTWRHETKYLFSFSTSVKLNDYQKLLESQNAVIIEKQHPHTIDIGVVLPCCSNTICVVSKEQAREIDTQELQLASDCLITDYSSVYYDSVLMNKPVIHFVYDYDHFMNKDMGFAFDMKDYGGGPFVETEDVLLETMRLSDSELIARRSPRTIREQLTYEKGKSCETYYNLLLKLSAA